MTKTFLVAAALLSLGFGTAQAAEEYQPPYPTGIVSSQAVAASPILESNAGVTAPQAANSLPSGFEAGTSFGATQYGTVLGR